MRWIAAVLLVCAVGTGASADGLYFSEGVGGFKVTDELAAYVSNGMRIRVALGMRRQNWAVEAWAGGLINSDFSYAEDGGYPSTKSYPPGGDYYTSPGDLGLYGLDVKYLNPISQHLDVYLRGSMSGAEGDGALRHWAGRGLGVGAGIQLKGKVPAIGFLWWPLFFTNIGPKVTAALWIDDGFDFYRLHGPSPTAIDAQVTHLSMGFAVGSDF